MVQAGRSPILSLTQRLTTSHALTILRTRSCKTSRTFFSRSGRSILSKFFQHYPRRRLAKPLIDHGNVSSPIGDAMLGDAERLGDAAGGHELPAMALAAVKGEGREALADRRS